MTAQLTVNGELSWNRKYLILPNDIRIILDPEWYKHRGFGELGLMPNDIGFSDDRQGIALQVTEDFGIERFGNLVMGSIDGRIGKVDLEFMCRASRSQNRYAVRHGPYKKDKLLALYLENGNTPHTNIGLAVLNHEEEYVAKLIGLGIKEGLQRHGHGTVFLRAIERQCARTNIFLVVHNPLTDEIPFYVKRGYRFIETAGEYDLGKVLNPGFDEQLLVPRN